MTTNNPCTGSDDAAKSAPAVSPEVGAVCIQAPVTASHGHPREAPEENGIEGLEELLTRLDSPELVSIRHLFNMC